MRFNMLLSLAVLATPLAPTLADVVTNPVDTAIVADPFNRPQIDIALLLDTSNSMDGLINQAKSQLWKIVQQFGDARLDGRAPVLRVALFEYGNSGLPATEGYIRQVVPLTDDLDKLSEALFALTTNGGDEYCGQVINEAVKRLAWSSAMTHGDRTRPSFKAIFIAGNEPFTQGDLNYKEACQTAKNHGILINTIHCGPREEGIRTMWQDGSVLGKGEFFNINQDATRPDIRCPQDDRLGELNRQLNDTYLWYGNHEARAGYATNQMAQDSNAASMAPSASAERAVAKSSGAYNNASRDLVDARQENSEALKAVKDEDLPEEMRKMSPEERETFVAKKSEQREALKQEIQKLAVEREAYYQQELQKLATANPDQSLGDAVVTAIRKQLTAAGYEPKADSGIVTPSK